MSPAALELALVMLVLAPVAVALLAAVFGPQAPRPIARCGALTAGLGFAAAVALAASAAAGEHVTVGTGVLAIAADPLATVLLLLIFGVSAVVQTFAIRYLAGDARAGWFTAGAGLLTAATAGLVTATTLICLAACWTIAGAALCVLLGMYWPLAAARDGVRRTALAFFVGDVALWVAVALAAADRGTIRLTEFGADPVEGPMVTVVAVLVVVAALSRSAQIPFHRWLPATLAAPTPVSALLHAGVINGGGILLLRLSPLTTTDLAQVLAIWAGAATMVYGAMVMLVKPDIKGALAHSTTAQMGFMILTCGLGLWAAAVIHLVAHGFYKATLFLASGSAIAHRRRLRALPPPRQLSTRATAASVGAAALLPLVALAVAVWLVRGPSEGQAAEQALWLFAWTTGAAATWGWLRRRPNLAAAATAAAFLLPTAVGYVAIVHEISRFLAPALPAPTVPAPAAWAIVVVALITLAALTALRSTRAAVALRRAAYTYALNSGYLAPQPTGATT